MSVLSLFMSVSLSHLNALYVVCCCVSCVSCVFVCWAVRVVVVVAVHVAVCVCACFFLSGTEKCSRVYVQNAPVCTFKTLPCVRSKRCRVYFQNARVTLGHRLFERTHGIVLNLLTKSLSCSSRVSLSLLFSCLCPLIRLSFSLSLCLLVFFCLLSALSLLCSMTMTMMLVLLALSVHTSLSCPEYQSAWADVQSLLGEHVRIMKETFVWVFLCKPGATWNEEGLYLCWKEKEMWFTHNEGDVTRCAVLCCDALCCCVVVWCVVKRKDMLRQ